MFYIQAIRGQYFYNLSKNNRIRVVPLEGWRGRIKDRNDVILADNLISYNVMLTPQEIDNQDKLFNFLAEVLNIEESKLINKYKLRKYAPFAPVTVAENIGRKAAIILEENKYKFPGLLVYESFKRYYPLKENSAHILGYVGKVNKTKKDRFKKYGFSPLTVVGYTGVEQYYDFYLKGEEGGIQIEVNNKSKQVRLLSLKEPNKGQDIQLTIDSRIQQTVMEEMGENVGVIIMMDIDNGEIISLISSPSYDPNTRFSSSKFSPFFNRAIQGKYPPGSVFKVLVAIAALESKKVNYNTSFICDGFYELAGIKFGCTHKHGLTNLIKSLVQSCNVYYYHLGLIIGSDLINRYAEMFGLGSLTNIDLPYEETGLVPNRRYRFLSGKRRWYTGDTLNLAIGQGDLLTTPIQLVKMISVVASEGFVVTPHIVKKVGDVEINNNVNNKKVKIDKDTFRLVKKALRATVVKEAGTAHSLYLDDINVSGKTGTAQTSGDKEHHSWFVGYIYTEEKDIAFCIFLEHGGSSQNACILGRRLLLRLKRENLI